MELYKEMIAVTKSLKAAKVPYAVCGGLALSIHGLPRATKDIDLIVRKRDVIKAKKAARSSGFMVEAAPMTFRAGTKNEMRVHRISKFVGEEHLVLDLIEVEPFHMDIWQTRRAIDTLDGPVTVVSREGLVEMKRQAGRPQDLVDIQRLEEGPDVPNA